MPDELLQGGAPAAAEPPAKQGSSNVAWYQKYEGAEGFKDLNILRKYDSPDKALIALDHAERKLSTKLTDLPSQDASEEDIHSFVENIRAKLPDQYRIPEKPDGYKITSTVKDAEGNDVPIPFDDSALREMQEACHKAGVDQKTFDKLVSHIYHSFQDLPNKYTEDVKSFLKEQAKINPKTPSYEEFSSRANREFASWPEELRQYVSSKNIPNDALAMIAHHYASKNGESRIPDGGEPPRSTLTFDDIRKRKSEILSDPAHSQQLNMGRGPLYDEYNRLTEMEKKLRKKG